jgi:hypothetical protein
MYTDKARSLSTERPTIVSVTFLGLNPSAFEAGELSLSPSKWVKKHEPMRHNPDVKRRSCQSQILTTGYPSEQNDNHSKSDDDIHHFSHSSRRVCHDVRERKGQVKDGAECERYGRRVLTPSSACEQPAIASRDGHATNFLLPPSTCSNSRVSLQGRILPFTRL